MTEFPSANRLEALGSIGDEADGCSKPSVHACDYDSSWKPVSVQGLEENVSNPKP